MNDNNSKSYLDFPPLDSNYHDSLDYPLLVTNSSQLKPILCC